MNPKDKQCNSWSEMHQKCADEILALKSGLSSLDQIIFALPDSIKIGGNEESRDVWVNGEMLDPHLSQKLHNHSPDGFAWGYGGSGASQLSLAILAAFLPAQLALSYYMDFKQFSTIKWKGDFEDSIELRRIIQFIKDTRDEQANSKSQK